MRRFLQLAAVIAVAAAFLVYALWDVDLRAVGAILGAADLALLAPFQAAVLAIFVLKAVRWAYLLAPVATVSFQAIGELGDC